MGRQPVGVLEDAPGFESNMRRVSFRSQDSHHSSSLRAGGNFEPQTPQERTSILPQRSSAQEFRPELDPRGSREKLRGGDRCTEHVQEPQTELHCENNKTGWDIPWKVIVVRQKGGDPCFSTSINKKAVGHLSLEQPIRHLWMPTRGREPGQNQLSSFLISSMHDDGGSQMPGAGRHRHKQKMDTGQQGAIFPAQRTCGPPPALFAARMPGWFDVESCQTNASCHPWTSFPPREFTRLSTYLLGEFSPHARMP